MTKVLIASVLLFTAIFVPFLGHMVVVGWMAITLRASVRGERGLAPLDWDFDRLLFYTLLGVETSVVLFVWTLPFTLLSITACVCGGLFGVLATATADLPPPAILMGIPLGYALAILVTVLGSLPAHVAAMRVMLTGDMERGFDVADVFRFTGRYFWPLTVGMFVTWLVGIPIAIIGLAFCFVGALPAYVLTHISSNDVLAQVYVRSLGEGGTPLVLGVETIPKSAGINR